MKMHTALLTTLAIVGVLALAGCDKKAAEETKAETQTSALSGDLFSSEPLADAGSLLEAKKSSKAGDTVTFTGTIGGRRAPFAEGRAVFLVADSALPVCGPDCPTPWDFCCEARESILENTATVQLVDVDGQPLKLDANGQGGLEPGASIQVRGTVAEKSEGAYVIDAEAVYVQAE